MKEIIDKLNNEFIERGISSSTIAYVLSGIDLYSKDKDIPHDPSDFSRCYKLLKIFPEWKVRLQEVADKYPKWQPFVNNWKYLEILYERYIRENNNTMTDLYFFMQGLKQSTSNYYKYK